MMLPMKHLPAALIALGLLAAGTSLAAQTAPTEAEALLASSKSLKCSFPVSVRTTWKDGLPQPVIRRTGNLIVEIRNINADSGSAAVVKGRNNLDLTMVPDQRSYHFLEAGGGRIALTTVLGEFSTGTKLKAAHSIREYVALEIASFRAEPEVVQYSGDCEAAP